MAKGRKTGGRRKGSTNKIGTIKDAVSLCFEAIGGHAAFAAWAAAHPSEFYTKVATRLIPQEVSGNKDAPIPLAIELTDGPTSTSGTE
jgi:hypothetical protein